MGRAEPVEHRCTAALRGAARSNSAIAAGFVVMWSSGFIGARLGTDTATTITILTWRFLVAAVVLLAGWALWHALRSNRRPLSRHEIGTQVAVGLLAQGVYLLGTVGAVELGVAAGTTALIAALQPILAGALAGPVLGEQVHRGQWLGLGVGLVGVVLVVGADLSAGHQTPPWAYLLPFVGMAGLIAATLLERKTHLGTPLGAALVIQCCASAVGFGLLALAAGQLAPPVHDGRFWAAVAWFVVLSTLGGYGFYWLNLTRTSVTRVSSLIYLTPPTTMVWAFGMFGETVRPLAGLGLLVCLGAVLVVHRWSGTPRHQTPR